MIKWIEGPVALRGRLGPFNYILVTSKVDAHPGTAATSGDGSTQPLLVD
jgi:hypothetical protein